MAAAPAPEKTHLHLVDAPCPTISSALSSAAPEMIAVPCWSSWKTGMLHRLPQLLLDVEAVGRLDVLEVDAADAWARGAGRTG